MLNFTKRYSASIEMIIRFLFFNLLTYCITLIDLWILKSPCIPEINPTWSWCMIILIYCWIPFAMLIIFSSKYTINSDIGQLFLSIFVWFWYQGDNGFIEWVWKCSFFWTFWNSLRRVGVNCSLKLDRLYLWSHQV